MSVPGQGSPFPLREGVTGRGVVAGGSSNRGGAEPAGFFWLLLPKVGVGGSGSRSSHGDAGGRTPRVGPGCARESVRGRQGLNVRECAQERPGQG